MKLKMLVILLGMSGVISAQEYNKYLIKPKKLGGSMYYYTNEKILGDFYDTKMFYLDLDRHPEKPQIVDVYLDNIDFELAGIQGPVPDNIVFNTYSPKRIGKGVINTYGKFFIPPYYTQVQSLSFKYVVDDVDRYFLLGRKLKNGNWQALTFDNDEDEKRIFNELPEKKDYNLLNRNAILFKDQNNKYGLMDFAGNIRLEANFDTCYVGFTFPTFPKNSTTLTTLGQSVGNRMPESLESAFNKMAVKYQSFLESREVLDENSKVFVMKNKEITVLFSENYITKPIKNAKLSKHHFERKEFYLLQGNNTEYDIIDVDGTPMDDKLKYAYFETIHRDTSGIERNWAFDPAKDYSKPYRLVNYDSIKLVENKRKEAEEAMKDQQKKEALEQRRLLENDPANYSTVVAGNYDIIELTDNGTKYYKTGYIYDNIFHSSWTKKNKVDMTIKFKGKIYQTDAQFYTYDINLSVTIDEREIGGNSFNVNQRIVKGYVLSADSENIAAGSAFSSISGTYNPQDREINITAQKTGGGVITIRAVKRPD